MHTSQINQHTGPVNSHTLAGIAQLGAQPLVEGTTAADASDAYAMLLRRRTVPYFPTWNLKSEVRLCAQYATDEDLSLAKLGLRLKARRQKVKDFLAAWGVDWKSRQIIRTNEPLLSRAA